MFLWMAVTPDEYELPIAVADTTRELSKMLGLKGNFIPKMYCLHKKGVYKDWSWYKIVKVELEEDM